MHDDLNDDVTYPLFICTVVQIDIEHKYTRIERTGLTSPSERCGVVSSNMKEKEQSYLYLLDK